jgi:anti-sigma regulatory factor (Ser/Thr protein kinase)
LPSSPGSITELSIDLSSIDFIDPYGMIGIIELGEYLKNQGINIKLILPKTEVLSYMLRLDFFKFTHSIFGEEGLPSTKIPRYIESDVLLEITPVKKSLDIHDIIAKVRKRAKSILQKHLNYDEEAIDNFIVALSEVCQNIPEHSQSTGLVAIQKYFYERRLKKNAVKIAVMDLGIGMKESLNRKLAYVLKEKWSDEIAIQKALFEGVSRYDDPGRGHGLTKVRQLVERWKGKITIRSGTAKIGIIPSWDIERLHDISLTYLPGTQISIILPAIS